MNAEAAGSPFTLGGPFFLIAGPCVLEDSSLNLRVARRLRRVSERFALPVYFKASFDKANRSSLEAFRGPGLAAGIELLKAVRDESGLPVLTDVHLPAQVEFLAEVVDALQVPAFLSRQTDLLVAVGRSGLPVNIKKGQWMAPEQIAHSVEKVRSGGAEAVSVTERGVAFGYGRWIVDMRSFSIMRDSAGCPTVFDATHSVQLPGAEGWRSGGEPQFIPALAGAAVAAGADGLFLEVHPAPEEAPSDSASMLSLDLLEPVLERVLAIRQALGHRDEGGGEPREGGARRG